MLFKWTVLCAVICVLNAAPHNQFGKAFNDILRAVLKQGQYQERQLQNELQKANRDISLCRMVLLKTVKSGESYTMKSCPLATKLLNMECSDSLDDQDKYAMHYCLMEYATDFEECPPRARDAAVEFVVQQINKIYHNQCQPESGPDFEK